jgi:hypothetical protein
MCHNIPPISVFYFLHNLFYWYLYLIITTPDPPNPPAVLDGVALEPAPPPPLFTVPAFAVEPDDLT